MFKKAVKSQSKLRAALFGPSGSGKTYTALSVASGMGGKIALIDSERKTAAKYADRFNFDTVDLDKKNIDEYVQYIKEAAKQGYDVLIIDSLSHAWQQLIETVDKLANAKYKGNSWSAWSEGTPEQRKLVDAIVSYPGHVIATMRSKTEWQTSTGENGKSRPVRVGLSPEQGKGIEYEFDILFEISPEHNAHIIKDRTGKFQDMVIEKPGKDFGKELIDWLNEGEARETKEPEKKAEPEKTLLEKHKELLNEITNLVKSKAPTGKDIFTADEIKSYSAECKALNKLSTKETVDGFEKVITELKDRIQKRLEPQEVAAEFVDDIPWDEKKDKQKTLEDIF